MASPLKVVVRVIGAAIALVLVAVALYAGNVAIGMRVAAPASGTLIGTSVTAPVQILRDARDVPHIRAGNEHDMFFAQGFVEGSDRLFQIDLLRRYVEGTLAEVLGSALLAPTNARARSPSP